MRVPASTSRIGRAPETKRPISSSGRCVADRPMRCIGLSRSSSRRSTESARCAPRFVPATACTSSRISVSTPRRVSRAADVSSRKSDSGVVIRTSGGCFAIACRSFCGVSPVRTPTRSVDRESGERAAQVALDVVVERLQRRDVEQAQTLARVRGQPVDPVEKGRQRLAGAGRRLDQDVLAGGDRGPALRLRRRRLAERVLEPGAGRRAERRERVHTNKCTPRALARDQPPDEQQHRGERRLRPPRPSVRRRGAPARASPRRGRARSCAPPSRRARSWAPRTRKLSP